MTKGMAGAKEALEGLAGRELAVLAGLRRRPMTRRELAARYGLSASTVSRLLDPLLCRRLVAEDGSEGHGVGRPPVTVRAQADAGYGIGLDVGGMHSRYVVTDFHGSVRACHREPTRSFRGNTDFGDYVVDLGSRALAAVYAQRRRVLGIVIAVSGVVDSARGVCHFCPNIRGPRNLAVGQVLEQGLGYPARLEDPARMQALAESRYGVAGGANDFLFVHIGIGVGSGIVLGGRLLEGAIGITGEIGHIPVSEAGPRCNCGNRGCLEAYVSGPALMRRAREGLEQGVYTSLSTVVGADGARLSVEAISEAASAGDKMALQIVDEAGEKLGIAIASAVNLLGFPLVVVGGGIANLGDPFYQAAQRAMRLRALAIASPHVRIVRSALDTYAAAHGAATLAIDRALEPDAAAVPVV